MNEVRGIKTWERRLTERPGTLERTIAGYEPLASIVLRMLAVLGVVVVNCRNTPVSQLLGQLTIPVNIREALTTSIRLSNALNLYTEVVVPTHVEVQEGGRY